jgi:hypothetical protein
VGRRPAPLWTVLAIAFLGSLGTGGATNGIFFLTKSAHDFTERMNFALGVVLGVTYIAGALGVGPLLRRLVRRLPWLSSRGAVALVLVVIGLACMLPWAAEALTGAKQPAAMWVFVAIFGPTTGALWPMVESFLSGGRRGTRLRSAIGRFNIVWSSALVVSFFAMAPLVKGHPILVLTLLGVAHLLTAVLAWWLPAEPAPHLHDEHEPHPASYAGLLRLFRTLLPVSYVVLSALSPLLPELTERLRIGAAWATPFAAIWMASRVGVFALLERWHGWHGRAWIGWAAIATLGAGFTACVLAPRFGVEAGRLVLAGGLAACGAGMAVIYVGALYYVMEVGEAQVDAGGSHEALIGVGYVLGPLVGLAAGVVAMKMGWPKDTARAVAVLAGAVGLGLAAWAAFRIRAGRRG